MQDHITDQSSQEIPYGYCHCGCGQKTNIATKNHTKSGYVKGEPYHYLLGHQSRLDSLMIPPNPIGLCQCGCGQLAPIAKHNDTKRGYIAGEPIRFISGHGSRRPPAERFWEKVNRDGPIHPILGTACWLWTASTFLSGYGQFYDGEGKIAAHRFSYELQYGPIPDELLALHKCDVRRCVNPSHIFLGTSADNTHDMFEKGRGKPPVGERSYTAKLNEEQVREIRRLHSEGIYTQRELERIHNVNYATINNIVNRVTWKHVK